MFDADRAGCVLCEFLDAPSRLIGLKPFPFVKIHVAAFQFFRPQVVAHESF
jgi:hypothetical protein